MHSFTSDCTLPPEGTNFVASPPIRGSLEILWSSLGVLILCTWSIVHLNVPSQVKATTGMEKFRRGFSRFRTKVVWMSFNLLAPEWIIAKALLDWISVWQLGSKLKEQAGFDNVPWNDAHTHLANMGGFGISFGDSAKPILKSGPTDGQDAEQKPGEKLRSPADLEETGADPRLNSDWLNQICKALLEMDAEDVDAEDVDAKDVDAKDVDAKDMDAQDVDAKDMDAQDVDAKDMDAKDMDAQDVDAKDMDAKDVDAYRVKEILEWSDMVLSPTNRRDQGWQIDSTNAELMANITPDQVKKVFSGRSSTSYLYDSLCRNLLLLRANLWILDAAQLLKARKLGIITSLPNISNDDLNDRNKGSCFIKAIAAGQTCWFVLQFLVRVGYKQTNTQLEVMVFAFAICSVFAYVLVWNRPKDVEHTTVLEAARHPRTGTDLLSLAAKGPGYRPSKSRSTIWISNSQMTPVSSRAEIKYLHIFFGTSSLVTSVFGALHCIAWNNTFPTRADQIIWRACSILTALIFPICSILAPLACKLFLHFSVRMESHHSSRALIWKGIIASFVIVRLLILIEVYRCLGFQSPDAFQVTSFKDVPHIG